MKYLSFKSKAVSAFKAAELCFENKSYDAMANRVYYSVFFYLRAVLDRFSPQFTPLMGNTHDQTWDEIVRIMRQKQMSVLQIQEFDKSRNIIKSSRQIADYEPLSLSAKAAPKVLSTGRNLITFINSNLLPVA